MSEHRKNRLHSFWPKQSSSDASPALEAPGLAEAKQFAAKLEPLVENVGAAIATHPRASLSLAAVIGAALGWFIKRK